MKNRSWYFLFLLFWVIPALACSGGSSVVATATAIATTKPKATATSGAKPQGTSSTSTGKFGPIKFSVGVLNDEQAIDPLTTFPDGVTLMYAVFDYSGMTKDENWRTEWKLNGEVQPDLVNNDTWKGDASGSWWVSIYNDKGIRTGEWELNLYIGDTLQQSAKVTVEANPAGQPDFGPITFSPDKTDKDTPANPLDVSKPVLPAGTTTVYAFFDGISVPKGTTWTSHWFHNGDSASDPKTHTWDFGPNENNWISFGSTDNSPLESGTYELQLSIGSNVVNVATYIMP